MAWTSVAKDRPESPNVSGGAALRLTLAGLRQAVQAVEPGALLVQPRILRRVIRGCHELPGLRLRVPHRKCFVIPRGPLLEIADHEDLDLGPGEEVPEVATLLPAPDQEKLDATPAGSMLVQYWRLLFHAAVHAALERRIDAGEITPAAIQGWIARIGATEFDEARTVLDQEGFLLPPVSDERVFVEFAAVYLELARFAWGLLPRYFPAIEDPKAVMEVISEAVDARRLFAATRLGGAPDPADDPQPASLDRILPETEAAPAQEGPASRRPSERKCRRFARRAEAAEARGNVVRALLWWQQAKRVAPKARLGQARNAARTTLDVLIRRLQAALGLAGDDPLRWREPLSVLAEQASRGIWTREGRLLYDLQKICVDHERNVFKIDLAGWIRTLGRQPLKRALPSQRDVLMVRHLQTALRRLAVVRLGDAQRQQLHDLLRAATERCEARLREQFRPVVLKALDGAGLVPRDPPENVARMKIVEELLDLVIERGFLTMGDLRDALARNDLKLPDVAGPSDLLGGDRLLRADRRLAAAMDGVHRPGEFYLRWMQRLSALGFGTPKGRLFTRWVAVPFGGAYVVLAGIEHLIVMLVGHDLHVEGGVWEMLARVLVVGTFLLGMIHSPAFRGEVRQSLAAVFAGMKSLLVDLPRRIVRSPPVQRVLQSRWWKLGYRFLLKPAVLTACLCLVMYGKDYAVKTSPQTAAGVFLAVSLVLNSRFGRDMEEISQEWAVRAWQRFGLHVFLRLFWLIMEISQAVLEGLERLLYMVDEWFRFRSGQGRAMFALKAVLGMAWAGLTYVIRFAVTVLIEPQINPVKHFPVVTVSHKLLFVLIWPLARLFELTLGMEPAAAYTSAAGVIWSIPGVFGFLVWELKENWRLYAANRRPCLGAVPIGHHGETMARFLRPGFHSGTIPKRFARLRRAERAARKKGQWTTVRKHFRKLHEVEESIRRQVDRGTAALLAEAACWKDAPLQVGDIRLATNRVRIELRARGGGLWITFDLRGGRLLAGAADGAWSAGLTTGQREVLRAALAGLFKQAGSEPSSRKPEESVQSAAEPAASQDGLTSSAREIAWDDWVRFWCDARAGRECHAPWLALGPPLTRPEG